MPESVRSRQDRRNAVRKSEVPASSRRPAAAAAGCGHASHRLIGKPTLVTVPPLKGIRHRFCTRWDEKPAAALGKSLLRLGICQPEDWTGSAVDFVERGYQRFCNQNGAREAGNVWKGSLRIIDSLFEMTELEYHNSKAELKEPPDSLFLIGDYEQAASVPIAATLSQLEREHPQLPAALYRVFVNDLYKWMRVYDYTDACDHAEMMMEDSSEEDLKDSYLPEVAKSVPQYMPKPNLSLSTRTLTRAVSFLEANCGKFSSSFARLIVREVLELHEECAGFQHPWPSHLVNEVPGLEEFLSETDGCGPGCAITWYEDDAISAAFDDQMQFVGQNGPIEPSIMMHINLHARSDRLDREVKRVFDYLGAMLRSLRLAARTVELIRDTYDGYLREHRKKSGLQALPGVAVVRQE
jgi:hypothetical protein